MHLNALVALFALLVGVDASDHHIRLAKRQTLVASASSTSSSSASSPSSGTGTGTASSTTSASSGSVVTLPSTGLVGTTIPPLSQITSGMPSPTTLPVTATYRPGTTPRISGAPPLPSSCKSASLVSISHLTVRSRLRCEPMAPSRPGRYHQYVYVLFWSCILSIHFSRLVAGPEVAEWMAELDGFDIPNIPPTNDGTCAGDPAAAAEAASRGWWTCGGHTRDTDITACPTKLTWGVSFDDGPAFYSQSSSLVSSLTSRSFTFPCLSLFIYSLTIQPSKSIFS